jgi:hypothetical protein
MRFVLLVSALILGFAPQAAAQDGPYRGAAPAIEVSTPIGGFTVREGEIGFRELVRPPYRFRPGFLYEYQDRCRQTRCLVDVRSLRDGRFVTRIDAPRVPRWMIEVEREPSDLGPPEEQPNEAPPEEEPPGEDGLVGEPPD